MDVPQEGEASIKVSKNENNNMDGVEFPKIVWQWKETRKFLGKMIDNPTAREKFLRETDDETIKLLKKSEEGAFLGTMLSKVLNVANENHANVLLGASRKPSRLRNKNVCSPGDCSSGTSNEGVDDTIYWNYCVFPSGRYFVDDIYMLSSFCLLRRKIIWTIVL